MTRRLALPAVLAFTLASAGVLLARAAAPPDLYSLFGPYDSVIADAWTGLTWQRRAQSVQPYAGAGAYCASLSLGSFSSGWRVPSYKELLTLVDESPHAEYQGGVELVSVAIDPNAFPGTPVDAAFWSSSLDPASSGHAYAVSFDGTMLQQSSSPELTALRYVRCVHDRPAADAGLE